MGRGTVIRQAAEAVRRYAWVLLAGVLVGLGSWPQSDLEPFKGIDGSWQVALHMAAAGGLDYGREIVYTFGPLGFLQVPTYVDALTVRLAFAYELLLTLLLGVSLVATLRPTFRLIPAAILALVVATASSGVQVTTIGFIWITALLLVPMPPLAARALAGGLGLLIGLELLGKLNSGIVLLGMAVVAVAALPAERRRVVALPLGVAALAGAAFGWLATGQSPGAIPGYLSGSWSIISGYSEIMWSDAPDLRWHLWVALVLAGLGLVAATGGSLRPDRIHLGLAAAWLILSFTAFKEGFVRHDNGHAFFFFMSMLGGFTAFAMVPRPRGPALLAGTIALTCIAATTSRGPLNWLDPRDRVSAFAEQAWTLADGSETNEAIARGREIIAAQAPLDGETLAALEGRDVHVGPTLAATAWAHRLRWRPLPTFQTYAAYREPLDRRNAEVMADADGPDRILRHFESGIDSRRLIWDDPLTQRAMLCNFRPVTTNETWQVLERTEDRCGEPRLVAEVETAYGETIRVPEAGAGEALYVEVDGVQVHGLERLRTMAYRAEERRVIVDDEDDHRLVPGTARGGLLLRVHPAADYPAPFSMNADAHTLRFTKGRDGTGSGDLRLRFYALPVRR